MAESEAVLFMDKTNVFEDLFSKKEGTDFIMSAFVTAVAAIFHKVPTLLTLFVISVFVDYLTGCIKSAVFLNEWNSKTGLQGIVKKAMYFVLIAVAFLVGYSIQEIGIQLGIELSISMYIGWYTVAVMLINEFTSILENLYVIIPDKIPVWLIKALKVSDDKLEHRINDIVCKNQDCEKCSLKERCTYYNKTEE